MEGNNPEGESEVKIYQDKEIFEAKREETYDPESTCGPNPKWSRKGAWFHSLNGCKNFVQMSRDEEGIHFRWPRQIPVIWKKGPMTEDCRQTWGDVMTEEEREGLEEIQ